MSLSLAKRSLRSFDIADAQTGHQKKVFGHVKGQKKTGSTKTMKHSSQDEKIKKLLLLTTTSMDDKVSRRLLRKATNKKASTLRKSNRPGDIDDEAEFEQPEKSVFTEEDFKNFEEELKKQNVQ